MEEIHAFINIDCFELQVWSKLLKLDLETKPVIVTNSQGVTLAVSYPARERGVGRNDNLATGLAKCPELTEFRVPEDEFGKPNQSESRAASQRIENCVRSIIKNEFEGGIVFSMKSSSDEMSLDLTVQVGTMLKTLSQSEININYHPHPNTKWIGHEGIQPGTHVKLAIAGMITAKILAEIKGTTDFDASGGIGYSNIIAQIACRISKPEGLAIVSRSKLETAYQLTKFEDAPGLKGKNGQIILQQFMNPYGSRMTTLLDFRLFVLASPGMLEGIVTANQVNRLNHLAQGTDSKSVVDSPKGPIMCSRTSRFGFQSITALKQGLDSRCKEICTRFKEELQNRSRRPESVQLKLQRFGGRLITGTVTVPCSEFMTPQDLLDELWRALKIKWSELEQEKDLGQIRKITLIAKMTPV